MDCHCSRALHGLASAAFLSLIGAVFSSLTNPGPYSHSQLQQIAYYLRTFADAVFVIWQALSSPAPTLHTHTPLVLQALLKYRILDPLFSKSNRISNSNQFYLILTWCFTAIVLMTNWNYFPISMCNWYDLLCQLGVKMKSQGFIPQVRTAWVSTCQVSQKLLPVLGLWEVLLPSDCLMTSEIYLPWRGQSWSQIPWPD